jgi:uncharacterized membrane protein HdeD (DUF308 family)
MKTQIEKALDLGDTPGGEQMRIARLASKSSIAFGAVLMVFGIFAVIAPMFAGIAVTTLVGMLLIFTGFVEIIFAFKSDSFGKGALKFLLGGLSVVAGGFIIATPVGSLGFLTLVLAVYLVVGGVFDIIFALKQQSAESKGWMLFSGIMSILLGLLIIFQWPVSGIWVVGLYVGIRILMHGWMLMELGRTGQDMLTHLQDTRIAKLEHHVRSGALALQETQAALAELTAMLLALDSELRKKVSLSEVDPAMKALNEKLGRARKVMEEAAKATEEAWDATQKEAAKEFKKLRESAAELSEKLRQELGIGEAEKS